MRPYSLFRRSVSLLLAVLVLLTSVGFTVQRLTCRMSGLSRVAIAVAGQADLRGCLGDLAPAIPVAKDNCCDFSQQVHKLSVPSPELAAKILLSAPLPTAAGFSDLAWPVSPTVTLLTYDSPRWFAADSSPPPRSGRALLAFVCTLMV